MQQSLRACYSPPHGNQRALISGRNATVSFIWLKSWIRAAAKTGEGAFALAATRMGHTRKQRPNIGSAVGVGQGAEPKFMDKH